MDSGVSLLRAALCSSIQLEKAMYAYLKSIPEGFACDGVFLNYYRSDIRAIQFLALATHKAARLKREIIPIPESISRRFDCRTDFSTKILNDLHDDPLTEYVVSTSFRNIKSVLLMRMSLDGIRLGAIGIFSYKANAFTPAHESLLESVRGELSLLSFITLSRYNLITTTSTTEPFIPTLEAGFEQGEFVVNPANQSLYALYLSLTNVACYEDPIIITGEEGVGKKTVAAFLRKQGEYKQKRYGILDVATSKLLLMTADGVEQSLALDFTQPPDINLFLTLHGSVVIIKELFSLPALWQAFLLQLPQHHRTYCHIKVIAIDTRDEQAQRVTATVQQRYLTTYRYHGVICQVITLPPLRQRHEDIPLLLTFHLTRLAKRYQRHSLPELGEATQKLLWEYEWPGNITELVSVLEGAFFSTQSNKLNIMLPSLPPSNEILSLDDAMKLHILMVLDHCNGKISGKGGAAELLKINSNTLYSKMKKLGIVAKPTEK